MAKFRKKPVEIEAVQYTGGPGGNCAAIQAFTGTDRFRPVIKPVADRDGIEAEVFDVLHSTWVGVSAGQWIIRGVQGEFYPCAADVFAATYDPVPDGTTS